MQPVAEAPLLLYVPMPQVTQDVDFVMSEYLPPIQLMQAGTPVLTPLYLPLAQSVHAVAANALLPCRCCNHWSI